MMVELATYAGGYTPARTNLVPSASVLDTAAFMAGVVLPTMAKGIIIRRRLALRIAETLDLDRRAIHCMQRIRDKYGAGPLLLRIPGRSLALILDRQHVHRVLGQTPEPFATATKEKVAALAHFEPKNVLLSSGAERADRRRYNEEVLESNRPIHELASAFAAVVNDEASRTIGNLRGADLTWREFSDAWFRMVRRVIFGQAAADDNQLSVIMAKLRSAANWAFLAPKKTGLRDQLLQRIRTYITRAEPNSLAGMMARTRTTAITAPDHQVPQWLFAFDPAAMATFRALALLASHPAYARLVRNEVAASSREDMPLTRAAILESLRLWPTSPLILRETTEPTQWPTGELPGETGLVIYSPFFHRDNERLPYADRFAPELWTGTDRQQTWPLIPFSEGPAVCPGRNLMLLLASTMIAAILDRGRVRLIDGRRLATDRLPGTLNHFRLRFEILPRA